MLDRNLGKKISAMDLKLLKISECVRKFEKMDNISCPLAYRKKQIQSTKPKINFNTYSLVLEQVQERHIAKQRDVTPLFNIQFIF